jgi:alpha-glucosidase
METQVPNFVTLPQDPVLYEVYVRSFADSDGDGIGDIRGITSHLDHFAKLGVDGIWLTPIFKSPQFDFGYDISDYRDIHEEFGTLDDVDELIQAAHDRNIAVVLDMVLNHTSIAHPWFRDHPERYHWADDVPNNWLSVFGGSAWEYDAPSGRYYYHRYYKEQPSLNWDNPEVREAMHEIVRFWVSRGVDGFRLDSLDGLAVDPQRKDEPPAESAGMIGREKDNWAAFWTLDHIYTSNLPQVAEEIKNLKDAFPQTAFVVEADIPLADLKPYMAAGASSFVFEFLRAPLDGGALGQTINGAGLDGDLAWAMSNHDQPRLVSRWGRARARSAAMLLLSLPGWVFIYQGDEIGMIDGQGGPVVYDRNGRDGVRQPMQWNRTGGFTTGEPWLPMIDPNECNVTDQDGVPGSMLELYRTLIRIRRSLTGSVTVLSSSVNHLVFRRDSAIVALNFGDQPLPLDYAGRIIMSVGSEFDEGNLPGNSGVMIAVE